MPLIQSSSKDAFTSNLKAELESGKPRAQALAIAYSTQRRNKADGGPVGYAMGGMSSLGRLPLRPLHTAMVVPHVGPIRGVTGGRADARPMQVRAGSYVIPADIVSHLGQGNSDAGHRVINTMFQGGPYGTSLPKVRGHGVGIPKPPGMSRLATGGGVPDEVPIYAADGEHVLSPEQVATAGDGDMKKGHDRIDAWVKIERQKAIDTLRKLPGPKR